jgi:hypothetical protein
MRINCLAMGLVVAALSAPVSASHFRGAAMVPTVSSSGLLTVTATSFWRQGAHDALSPSVAGIGFMSQSSLVRDSSDPRFDRVTQVFTIQLAASGTYNISSTSCCRVATGGLGNWLESDFTMNSAIVWNGSTASNPIAFNFGSVQSEVSRLGAYSDNLDATSPDGLTLSYNQNLNQNITSQVPGFVVDPSTGGLSIPAANTPSIVDHAQAQNIGADAAFSGNIIASDGSFVEFDWMFDGVDAAVNNAPDVSDGVLADVVGTVFNFLFAITDPGDTTSFDPGLFAILGPSPVLAPIFDHLTGLLTWDSAGSAPGQYIFQVRGRDSGNLTDVGSVNITVQQSNNVVPEPGSLLVHGGLILSTVLGSLGWKKVKKMRAHDCFDA